MGLAENIRAGVRVVIELWDDQIELVSTTRDAMRRSKAVLMQSCTGSGKTMMAAYIIQSALARGRRVMFTVPRRDLITQTSNTFTACGMAHSFVAAGRPFNPFSRLFIGSVDSMARRMDKLPDCDLVIVDETHFGDGALDKVIGYYKQRGAWLLGLSATPWKLSGDGLGKWYDELVLGKTMKWLIDNKRLSDYRYYRGRTRLDTSKIKRAGGDFHKRDLDDFMEAHEGVIIGDAVSDYKARCMGNLHITRCVSVKRSQRMAEAYRSAGISAMHVDGEMDSGERMRIFTAYARGEILVLTFADLLGFGWDLKQITGIDATIESCSDTKPSESLAGQMQFWGRVLRMKDRPAVINDHVNNCMTHGMPCDDREWTLEGREKRGGGGERASPVRTCAECYFTHKPAPSCPACGYVYPIQSREVDEVAGDLVEVKRGEKLVKPPPTPAQLAKQRWALIHNAQKRGIPNPHAYAEKIMKRQAEKRDAN